jgi:hypothetical protein
MSSTFKNNGLFPGMKEYWDNGVSHTKEHVGNHKKLYLGVGAGLALWATLSYVGPIESDIPAPLDIAGQAMESTGELVGNINDAAESPSSPQSAIPTTIDMAPETSQAESTATPSTTIASTSDTLPTINSVPLTTLATIPATTETLTNTPSNTELPNPMIYSTAAGSVACSGELVYPTVDLSDDRSSAPLSQLSVQTGEGWDLSASQGPNAFDEALFNEWLQTATDNGDGTFTGPARLGCTGLEK